MSAESSPPRVSVITVSFNAAPLLEPTLDAVAALPHTALEHVVVDGGSRDGTVEMLRNRGGDGLRWISERDRGIYDAMNKGLALARGEYVWFLNAGDLPAGPTVLDPLWQPDAPDVLYGDTELVDESGRLRKVARAPGRICADDMVYGMLVSHQSFVVRRALAPAYDLRYHYIADNKWVLECLRRAVRTRHGGTLSRYLLGGLTSRRYAQCLVEKVRFTFDELPWPRATIVAASDLAKGARHYVGAAWRGLRA